MSVNKQPIIIIIVIIIILQTIHVLLDVLMEIFGEFKLYYTHHTKIGLFL